MSFVDRETLRKVAGLLGEEAERIIDILKADEEITDDEISALTEMRLNDIRKTLYRLYDHSLVALRRSRDSETGWFIFHWRLQPDQVEGYILNKKRRALEKLEARLDYEKTHAFYKCSTINCRRMDFEEAMECLFRCPTCGEMLIHSDNRGIIEALTKKIDLLKKEMNE